MKFKVGDTVKTSRGDGVIVFFDKIDETYLVKVQGFKGHSGGSGYINEDSESDKWWFTERELELIKSDLRDLLQVGYKVHYEVFGEDDLEVVLKGNNEFNSNLMNGERLLWAKEYLSDCLESECCKIIEIYRPKYNGVKPMEWVLIWEREKEKLYTLELPNNNHKHKYYRHHFNGNYSFNKGLINDSNVKCIFTQEEIDNLPNQELIKALVKKEVKGN